MLSAPSGCGRDVLTHYNVRRNGRSMTGVKRKMLLTADCLSLKFFPAFGVINVPAQKSGQFMLSLSPVLAHTFEQHPGNFENTHFVFLDELKPECKRIEKIVNPVHNDCVVYLFNLLFHHVIRWYLVYRNKRIIGVIHCQPPGFLITNLIITFFSGDAMEKEIHDYGTF
jgi:hypothetical protein